MPAPTRTAPRRRPTRWRDERGSGPVPTAAGFLVFLLFLLLATQTLLHLYATSTAGTAAFESARRVATGQFGCDRAEPHTRELLGGWGARPDVVVTCTDLGEAITVAVRGPSPAGLVTAFSTATGLSAVDRSATVRRELFS